MAKPLSWGIKGVLKKKGVRGSPVQFKPAEKIPIAVKSALGDYFRKQGFSPATTELKVESFTCNPKGELFKKIFANNSYSAKGSITYFLREHAGDRVYEKQTSTFSIAFEDALDRNGMPFTSVTRFVLD